MICTEPMESKSSILYKWFVDIIDEEQGYKVLLTVWDNNRDICHKRAEDILDMLIKQQQYIKIKLAAENVVAAFDMGWKNINGVMEILQETLGKDRF